MWISTCKLTYREGTQEFVSGNFSDELKSNPYDKVPCYSYQKVPRWQGLRTQWVKQDVLETQSFKTPDVTTSFSEAQGSHTKESLARPEKDRIYKVNSEGAIHLLLLHRQAGPNRSVCLESLFNYTS